MASIKKDSYHGTLVGYLTLALFLPKIFSAPLTGSCSSYWETVWPAKLSRVHRFFGNSVLKMQFLRPKPHFELSLNVCFKDTFIRWHSFHRALTKNLSLFMSKTTCAEFSSQPYSDLTKRRFSFIHVFFAWYSRQRWVGPRNTNLIWLFSYCSDSIRFVRKNRLGE